MAGTPSSRANARFDPDFRWRSDGVSRLEGLTDAVFAIVLALLFLRAQPPRDYDELFAAVRSLLPFAATFAIIVYVWFESWLFSRRFALRDGWTMVLTLLLLFLLLFYAYPLKFLFTLISGMFFGGTGDLDPAMLQRHDADGVVGLFLVYGVGYGAIFGTIGLLYWRALAFADELGLTPVERAITVGGIRQCVIQVTIACLSITLALAGFVHYGMPGWVYGLIGPAMAFNGVAQGRRVEKLKKLAAGQPS